MKCSHCPNQAAKVVSRVHLCPRHYRTQQMRSNARAKGKVVPSRELLEGLLDDMVASSMRCVGCSRKMNWLREDGASTVVTLQHDRSGEIRLLCSRCNAQHRLLPGDSFYDVPAGRKHCPGCRTILPLSDFHRDRLTQSGVQTRCKACKKLQRAGGVSR
jgi:RNase P subunit RPR2